VVAVLVEFLGEVAIHELVEVDRLAFLVE